MFSRTAYHVVTCSVLCVLGNNDALRAVSIHPLEVPDGVIMIYLGAKYMTPSASYALRHQIVINVPVPADRFHIGPVARVPIPGRIHREMGAIGRGAVIRMIKINYIVKLVGWNKQGSVIRAIGTDATIRVFARLRQSSDEITDPAPSSIASVDPALGMIALEALEQITKIMIGSESIRIV